jgi:photosystem II stability/assembly factor-like uncharacterized protein
VGWFLLLLVTCAAVDVATARDASADGAFPDSSQVLLPPGRPNEAILATNFGLLSTRDGGASWEWTCETPLLAQAQFYQLGDSDRIVASSLWGVVRSDDSSCTWEGATGEIARTNVTDVFVNPAAPLHVLAIGVAEDQVMGLPQLAYDSQDGGATFGAPIFSATGDAGLLGIESAASDPRTIYLTLYTAPSQASLVRTLDAGKTWETIDLQPALGPGIARIIAVDSVDAKIVYLRMSRDPSGETLAISSDGGTTFRTPFSASGSLTAFVRRANGTLLVAGMSSDGLAVAGRSHDGGRTFEPWAAPPHLRGLAERDGMLYGAADNFADGFALGTSSDDGEHWQPMLTYDHVTRIKPCVLAGCQRACQKNVELGLWGAATCEAGTSGADGGGPQGGSAGGSTADGGMNLAGPDPAAPAGCSCDATPASRTRAPSPLESILLVVAGLLGVRIARARRPRSRAAHVRA